MANKEHLKILKSGVKAWNLWRSQNPTVIPDLSGAELGIAKLCGANLANSQLQYAKLGSAQLDNAILSEANLKFTSVPSG